MVSAATGDHGHLLQLPKEWNRLPGVDDPGVRPLHAVDEGARRGRDPAELSQQVQRQALGGEDASRIAADRGQSRASLDDVAVLRKRPDLDLVVEQLEAAQGDRQARDTPVLTRDDVSDGIGVLGDRRLGGDVAALSEVFGECSGEEAVEVDDRSGFRSTQT